MQALGRDPVVCCHCAGRKNFSMMMESKKQTPSFPSPEERDLFIYY